jgi:hypothetical protein
MIGGMDIRRKKMQMIKSDLRLDLELQTLKEARDDARDWGTALNNAAWVFVDECPEKSALLFNTCKPALRSAILSYLNELMDEKEKEISYVTKK